MKKRVIPVLPAVLSGALFVGVVQAVPADTPTPSISRPASRATAPAAAPAPANVAIDTKATPVAAVVGKEEIRTADLNRLVDGVVEAQPRLAENTPEAKSALKKIRDDLLDNMIAQRLIYQAGKQKFAPTQEQVDTAVWSIQKGFVNAADFNKWMADEGKDMTQLRDMLTRRIITEAWKNDIVTSTANKVSDEDITTFYKKNIESFTIPETVWARHIQLSFPVDKDGKPTTMTPQDRKKLQQKAQDLMNRAKNTAADFASLAQEFSDDGLSKAREGVLDIPEVNEETGGVAFRQITKEDKDLVDPALFDVLFTAPVGKVYPQVVESKFGFHVIKIEERKPGRVLPYTDVKETIKPLVIQELSKQAIDAKVAEMKVSANVKKFI